MSGGTDGGRISLSLAVSDYDHVRDLTTGRVRVEGVALTCLQLPVEEIFFRFTAYREWDVSELSLAKYVAMAGAGDTSVVAIPVFPSRVFRHSAVYVRRAGPVRAVGDLAGARIGVPEWFQTAGVWVRGILQHDHGLDLAGVRWVQGGVNQPGRREQFALPAGYTVEVVADRSLGDLLADGALDAVISAHPPERGDGPDAPVVPLFPDAAERERDWYRRTGLYPIMHVIVVRRAVVDAHPWIPMNLVQGFVAARDRGLARATDLNASRFPVPWLPAYAREMAALFGGQPFPYGVEPNRHSLAAFLEYAAEQGITPRPLAVDDLFPPPVRAEYRI
ncbi:MAG TPA: ABC transporter substrate-binding protein [Rugosimonospora sp.]|nr:ABC transporter substrate-binding protein [Rugosimonospora sp.]